VAELDPQVIVICDRCDHIRQYDRESLLARHGSDMTAIELLAEIAKAAGCVRAVLASTTDGCRLRFLGLRQSRARSRN
jgi:hypothetical protein